MCVDFVVKCTSKLQGISCFNLISVSKIIKNVCYYLLALVITVLWALVTMPKLAINFQYVNPFTAVINARNTLGENMAIFMLFWCYI